MALAVVLYRRAAAARVTRGALEEQLRLTQTITDNATAALFLENTQGNERASVISRHEGLEGVKVLVVDDEEDTRQLLRILLSDREADVIVVDSAAKALEEVPRFRPDVLLSDIGMPVQDGYQLLQTLRALGAKRGGDTPAVALTAFARPEDRARALSIGYQAHVAKPVKASELIAVVAGLAGRAEAHHGLSL
jgi:CheY-like chemotaxis protein